MIIDYKVLSVLISIDSMFIRHFYDYLKTFAIDADDNDDFFA